MGRGNPNPVRRLENLIPGGGRKKGQPTKRTIKRMAAIQARMADPDNRKPLDVMLETMYYHDYEAQQLLEDMVAAVESVSPTADLPELKEEIHTFVNGMLRRDHHLDKALKAAEAAAPYMYPRLSAIAIKPVPPDSQARTAVRVRLVRPGEREPSRDVARLLDQRQEAAE